MYWKFWQKRDNFIPNLAAHERAKQKEILRDAGVLPDTYDDWDKLFDLLEAERLEEDAEDDLMDMANERMAELKTDEVEDFGDQDR